MAGVQEPRAGVDVTASHNVPSFTLGSLAVDSSNTVYQYVKASEAKSVSIPQLIDCNYNLHSNAVRSYTAANMPMVVGIGVPQTAFATPATGYTYRYGWVAVAGPFLASLCVNVTKLPVSLGLNLTGGISTKQDDPAVSVIQGLCLRSTCISSTYAGFVASDYMKPTMP